MTSPPNTTSTEGINRQISSYRMLTAAIAFSIVVHGVSLLTMLLLLQPGLDTQAEVLDRARYVAENPWVWRLGWFPWQITAASDLAVSLLLVLFIARTPGKRGWTAAWCGLLCTIMAVVPDQWGEAVFVRMYVDLAGETLVNSDVTTYLAAEARGLLLTGTCGAAGYSLMSAGWLVASVQSAGGLRRHRSFALVGAVCLLCFSITVGANGWAATHASVNGGYPLFGVVYGFNALAFPLLLIWMVWMGAVLGDGHHRRHPSADTWLHTPKSPNAGWRQTFSTVCSAPGLRDMFRWLVPLPVLASDITHVVYLNWRVPVDRVWPYLRAPLTLHVVEGHTWVSVLTYRHGHIAARFLGPFRGLFASPNQSNWRFYLNPEANGPRDSIYFFKTMMGHPVLAPLSRLLSDGLPSHTTAEFEHSHADGVYVTRIVAGTGSSPSMLSEVRASGSTIAEKGEDYRATVKYLVEQNRGVHVNAGQGRIGESRISIPIDIDSILPLEVAHFESEFLLPMIVGDAECLAFVVPEVDFRALGEGWTGEL